MTLGPHAPKTKACKVCAKPFTPARPLQAVCSPRCAGKLGKLSRAKERAETRAKREAIKRLPDLHREAQKAFNEWIRLRDADQPCISCGAPPPDLSALHAGRDAGHYRSIGSAAHLRYHEDNVNAQCVHCNQFGAGRAVEYRIGLIDRIGWARVHALECDNEPHKWTKDEVRAIRDTYRAKVRERKQLENQ